MEVTLAQQMFQAILVVTLFLGTDFTWISHPKLYQAPFGVIFCTSTSSKVKTSCFFPTNRNVVKVVGMFFGSKCLNQFHMLIIFLLEASLKKFDKHICFTHVFEKYVFNFCLLKVTVYFLPWEITINPPFREYFVPTTLSKSKFT